MNGVPDSSYESASEDGYYPGLVNISGTYCFMNSTVQVSHFPRTRLVRMSSPSLGHGIALLLATTAGEDSCAC